MVRHAFSVHTRKVAFLALCCSALAQQPAVPENLRWTAELHDSFSQMQDPVVVTFGVARLGALVCAQDKAVGSRLAIEAFHDLKNLPGDAFDDSLAPLPVSNFTALSKLVLQAAKTCEVGSEAVNLDDAGTRSRLNSEWMKANIWLHKALDVKDPNRAVQLADAAFFVPNHGSVLRVKALVYGRDYGVSREAGYFIAPQTLDLSLFSRVLAKVKEAAPDLTDALFQKTLDGMASASPPTAAELGELARYLFPAGPSIQLPVDPRWIVKPPGGLPMASFLHVDLRANLDLAVSFLDKAAEVVQNYQTTAADTLDAYALAYQMLPKARQYALQDVGPFETALLGLEPKLGEKAAKIRDDLGTVPAVDPYGAPQSEFIVTAESLSHLRAGHFDAARAGLTGFGDTSVRGQLEGLIAFEEAAESLPHHDAERVLDRPVYPDAGAKRALLYTAIVPSAGTREGALRALQLAVKETDPLPAAQRRCLLPALASAALPIDADQALDLVRQFVKADNDSSIEPANPRCGESGLPELVITKEGPLAFLLQVAGVHTYSIDAVLAQARNIDLAKLGSAVAELHDETHRALALLTLAELRLQRAPH
jgi:hypothetical protein